jgi:membrane-bound metal-dependent hydrolase YbcI (DUF457 family)
MYIYAHGAIGWGLAEAGGGSRRLRHVVFLSSLAPDLDGLSLLFGEIAYGSYHHRITHSLLFSIVVSVVAVVYCRQEKLKALSLTQLAFYLHYFGDYFFTKWPSVFFYPFSEAEFNFSHSVWLGHPVNHLFNLLSVASIFALGWRFKRTPFEVISPKLDKRVCNLFFQKKNHLCSICGRATNERCERCNKPVCVRHAPLNLKQSVVCEDCKSSKAEQQDPALSPADVASGEA